MRNIFLTLLVVAGLFMIMGCAGQSTTTQTNQTAQQQAEQQAAQQAAQQQAAQQAAKQAAQQALQNQSLPKTLDCVAGTYYKQGNMQGTIVGVEMFYGRSACHITFSFNEAKFDYYLDMNNPEDICYVMSGSEGVEPTTVCNWQ